jgi:hypothetical protein
LEFFGDSCGNAAGGNATGLSVTDYLFFAAT